MSTARELAQVQTALGSYLLELAELAERPEVARLLRAQARAALDEADALSGEEPTEEAATPPTLLSRREH